MKITDPPTITLLESLAKSGKYFWTFSINYLGELHRTLIPIGGVNNYLPYAPPTLPIYQTHELPGTGYRPKTKEAKN